MGRGMWADAMATGSAGSPMKIAPNPHRAAPTAPGSGKASSGSKTPFSASAGSTLASRLIATDKTLAGAKDGGSGGVESRRPQSARATMEAGPSSAGGGGSGGGGGGGSAGGSLAARLKMAAGVSGMGFKSIADIAKPSMKTGLAKKLITQSPLDAAMRNSLVCREDAKRAMAEGEINLTKMYARDHDGMVTARALLVGANKALTKLMGAADILEQEAAKARARLQSDHEALGVANAGSISMLTHERDTLVRMLVREIHHIENDAHFSLETLSTSLHKTQNLMAHQGQTLTSERDDLDYNLQGSRERHEQYVREAEQKEARLSAEIARLCAVCDKLKADAEAAAKEHAAMHAGVVNTMSNALADKQRSIEERDARINELEDELHGTRSSMTNQLRDLAREKEMREKRLQEENAQAMERNKRASADYQHRLDMLAQEKAAKEAALASSLQATQERAEKEASALQTKIEKMRKLQELALGGVGGGAPGGADGSPGAEGGGPGGGRRPSTRGRQLLYWEALKSKKSEQSSMSWRGQDVFAHEELGKTKVGSPR